MKRIFLLTSGVLVFAVMLGCKKNALGGKSHISGTVMHHSRFIPRARVFIKFNATEFPGKDTSLYDAKIWADDLGNYLITCYQGSYYLYAFAYDDQFAKDVNGGIPVNIRTNENLSLDLAVNE
jgi:hypothetical protein